MKFIRYPWRLIIDYRIFFFFWIGRDEIKERFQIKKLVDIVYRENEVVCIFFFSSKEGSIFSK